MKAFGIWVILVLAMLQTHIVSAYDAQQTSIHKPQEKSEPWFDLQYTKRYALRVAPPPAAGSLDLQSEPSVASIYLPLATFNEEHGIRIEDLLLVGEQNLIQPLLARVVENGNQVELAFPTRSGQRRFWLYHGAQAGRAEQKSFMSYQPQAIRVQVRAQVVPDPWPPSGGTLTLKDFEAVPRYLGSQGQTTRINIDDPEPPFALFKYPHIHINPVPLPNPRIYPANYISVYEGFLRVPVDGEYVFGVSTYGAAFLAINGEPLIECGTPDIERKLDALQGRVVLRAGIHRLGLYHAQLQAEPGIRVFWKPPYSRGLETIPAQAFPRALPAMIVDLEDRSGARLSALHLELCDHVVTNLHRGPEHKQEWQQFYYRAINADGKRVQLQLENGLPQTLPAYGLVRVPAGRYFDLRVVDQGEQPLSARKVLFPTLGNGARDVREIHAELAIRALPNFLYPDEIGQFYLAARQHRIPAIIPKERLMNGPKVPDARPEGQYLLRWLFPVAALDRVENVTPFGIREADLVTGRKAEGVSEKGVRLPFPVGMLAREIPAEGLRMELQLYCGDTPIEFLPIRLLDAQKPFNRPLQVDNGVFYFDQPRDSDASNNLQVQRERLLFVVRRADDALYRRFALLNTPGSGVRLGPNLLLGDPLSAALDQGLPKELNTGDSHWHLALTLTPYREYTVFRLLQQLEIFVGQRKSASVAVVVLGSGDQEMQTPFHDFERALHVLIDRLRVHGIHRILLVGALPKPGYKEQGRRYQEIVTRLCRRHQVPFIDLFREWGGDNAWAERFAIAPGVAIYGAYPNAKTVEEIGGLIKNRLP